MGCNEYTPCLLYTSMDGRDPGYLADYIAQNIALRYTDKQEILEELSPFIRLRKMNAFLADVYKRQAVSSGAFRCL